MKNVAIINSCNELSTGKIALGLYKALRKREYNAYFYYGHGPDMNDDHIIKMESMFEIKLHILLARLTGYQGSFSNVATTRLIADMKSKSIDTIYVLSIHGFYVNEARLLDYIAKDGLRLVYIMIDEYAYLGNCCGVMDCTLYKDGCKGCANKKKYPGSWFFNQSDKIYKRKVNCYKRLKDAVFVGPEYSIVTAKSSPLSHYMKFEVLDEAINLNLYRPKDSGKLRKELAIADDKIVIGTIVSTISPSKGALYFTQMAKAFAEDDRFVFVHVGYRLRDKDALPKNYIAIDYVEKDEDLVDYLSLYDLFVFPSLMDTMSNVCLEALACGTPLLCFDISGMPYLLDETVGTLVPSRDVNALIETVKMTKKKTQTMIDGCRAYAERRYDQRKYSARLIEIARERNNKS